MNTVKLEFSITDSENDKYVINCSINGLDAICNEFYPISDRVNNLVEDIHNGNCTKDDLCELGVELWTSLTPGGILSAINETLNEKQNSDLHIYLRLIDKFESLPWEALYIEGPFGFIAADSRHTLIRAYERPGDKNPAVEIDKNNPSNILVAVPEGAGLQSSNEVTKLKTATHDVSQLVEFNLMEGRVTTDKLAIKLAGDCQMFHFIGHGQMVKDRGVTIRLNTDSGEEHWIDADAFSANFTNNNIKLVVLNCCEGDAAAARRTMDRFGPSLIYNGVDAIIAMRYPIDDRMAVLFATHFYKSLFGKAQGRVDVAVQTARHRLRSNASIDQVRAFITPAVYIVPGGEQAFKFTDVKKIKTKVRDEPINGEVQLKESLPDNFLKSFHERRWCLVLGSGLIPPPQLRDQIPFPTNRNLIEKLSIECKYPNASDIKLGETGGLWLEEIALQIVAEFAIQSGGVPRYNMFELVKGVFGNHAPHRLHNMLVGLPVNTFFYLPIDGMIESAFSSTDRQPTVIHDIEKPPEINNEGQTVVLVRGSITNIGGHVVIAENDHENLYRKILTLDGTISALSGQNGTSVVFMGCHPRDPLVRRIATKLLHSADDGIQDKPYFVSTGIQESDKAYWKPFGCGWIDESAESVIEYLASDQSKMSFSHE